MSKFTQGGKPKPQQSPAITIKVDGSFDCQICYEEVEEAEYHPQAQQLGWICSKGHISKISEFVL